MMAQLARQAMCTRNRLQLGRCAEDWTGLTFPVSGHRSLCSILLTPCDPGPSRFTTWLQEHRTSRDETNSDDDDFQSAREEFSSDEDDAGAIADMTSTSHGVTGTGHETGEAAASPGSANGDAPAPTPAPDPDAAWADVLVLPTRRLPGQPGHALGPPMWLRLARPHAEWLRLVQQAWAAAPWPGEAWQVVPVADHALVPVPVGWTTAATGGGPGAGAAGAATTMGAPAAGAAAATTAATGAAATAAGPSAPAAAQAGPSRAEWRAPVCEREAARAASSGSWLPPQEPQRPQRQIKRSGKGKGKGKKR